MERLAAAGEAAALARCLEQLEAKQRQSIVLAFFHGLSHSELAEPHEGAAGHGEDLGTQRIGAAEKLPFRRL